MRKRNEIKEQERLHQENMELFSENQELKLQLEQYKWQMEEIQKQEQEIRELHQNVRKLKHDMRNHMMVIAAYLNNQEVIEAKEYTSEILDRLNTMQSYVETGNSILNHILNEKLQVARSKNIDIKAQIDQVPFERCKGIDLSALLGNILDNAIEASEKESMKEIQIKIFRKRGYDAIFVKNRIEKSVLSENPELRSTKEDASNHGYGIRQIKDICEQVEGMFDFYEEEYFFCVNVFIPQ